MKYDRVAAPQPRMDMYEFTEEVANLVDAMRLTRRHPESQDALALFSEIVEGIFSKHGEDVLQQVLEAAEVADKVRIGGDA